jgi:hypothetical protein
VNDLRIPSLIPSLLGALVLLALPAVSGAGVQPGDGSDLTQQQQTISDIRSVGTAMYHWYKDVLAPRRSEEAHKQAEAASKAASADMTAVPVISPEELEKLLVPKYIAAIPRRDGWGHPYEFRLETKNPNAVQVMGLRSAGKDGRFSGDVYEIGAFAAGDFGQDISWMDGYFVHWPQKK